LQPTLPIAAVQLLGRSLASSGRLHRKGLGSRESRSSEEKLYPRHLKSFPLFGIEAHGFWTAKERVEPRLFVLASYGRAKIPARSLGGTRKAQNSLTTS
jgi:hypothetical protein